MDKFVPPSIPRIHVPSSSSSDHKTNKKVQEKSSDHPGSTEKDENTIKVLETPPPKLCPSCSKVLLEYLIPLQQYINNVIEMTVQECGLNHVATQLAGQSRGLRSLTTPAQSSLTSTEAHKEQPMQAPQTSNVSVHHSIESVKSASKQQTNAKNRESIPFHSQSTSLPKPNPGPDKIKSSTFAGDVKEHHDNDPQSHKSHPSAHNRSRQNNQNIVISDRRHVDDGQSIRDGGNHPGRNSDTRIVPSGHVQRSRSAERVIDTAADTSHRDKVSESGGRTRSFTIPGPKVVQEIFEQQNLERFESDDIPSISGYGDPSCEDHVNSQFEPSNIGSEQLFVQNNSQDEDIMESVNAYVTIVYNNLSAINAIILANSIIITRKQSEQSNSIPFIVLLGGKIDPTLRQSIEMLFDQVINLVQDFRLSLISNLTLGQQPLKFQLWKVLSHFKKCLFIESACIVVSDISHVFNEFSELSACVDWIFPDFFSCSVFVMEPNEKTYNDLVQFATEANEDSDGDFDEGIDEMVVLNQYFASKWNKVSFVYNFVPNSAVYTQTPAFLKFGGDVKIVNFGYSTVNVSGSKGSSQPWHVMFDLSTNDHVSTSAPVDNFTLFYLDIFLKRLWPLLQQTLTPLLLTRIGKREWSVYELTRFLSVGSQTEDSMYNPISMRRRAPVINLPQAVIAETENVTTLFKEPEKIEESDNLLVEETTVKEYKEHKIEEISVENETNEQLDGKASASAAVVEESIESKMRPWDTGSIDWMGVHKSDKIIERLMGMMKD